MEINTEINKVFGEEMAKLFAAQISEEELAAKAQEAWMKINHKDTSYWSKNKSELEMEIEKELLARVNEKINEILESEEGKKATEEVALAMIQQIRARTYDKIIENASGLIASLYGGAQYNGMSLQNIINETINQAMR